MSRISILSPNGTSDETDHRTYQSLSSIPGEPAADPPASLKSMASSVPPGNGISYFRATMMIMSLGVLIFLQASNISLLTTTQGVIAGDLDAFEETSWFTSAYLVAMASISPVTGRLSYIITPRYTMFISTIIMSIGSLIAGLAPSLVIFLLGRAVSGVGAAGILTVAIILIVQLSSPQRRGLFNGLLNTGFTIGVAAGAVAAGALEPIVGWRALFWMQSPLALVGGTCLLLSIPSRLSAASTKRGDDEGKSIGQRLAEVDYLGAILLILSIVSLLYGLSTPKISLVPIAISLSIFPLFLAQEIYRHPDPIVPVSVLRSRGALLSCLATLGFMMSRWAVLFYTPIFATAVRGWSPATAGSILVPTNTGFAIGSLFSGILHIRRAGSFYAASLVIFAVFPATLLALALVCNANSPTWLIVLCTFSNGLCAGAGLNYTLHHVLHLVLPEVRFIVTSLLATFRGFAGTFGSAIGGGIFVRVLRRSLERGFKENGIHGRDALVRQLLGSPRAVQKLNSVERGIAEQAYTNAVKTLFLTGVGLSIAVFFVQAGTGWKEPQERFQDVLYSPIGDGEIDDEHNGSGSEGEEGPVHISTVHRPDR